MYYISWTTWLCNSEMVALSWVTSAHAHVAMSKPEFSGSWCWMLRMVSGVGKGKVHPRGFREIALLVQSWRAEDGWAQAGLCCVPASRQHMVKFILCLTLWGLYWLQLVCVHMWVLIYRPKTRWWALALAGLWGGDSVWVAAALGHVVLLSSPPALGLEWFVT